MLQCKWYSCPNSAGFAGQIEMYRGVGQDWYSDIIKTALAVRGQQAVSAFWQMIRQLAVAVRQCSSSHY